MWIYAVKRWLECDKDLDAMYGTCKIGLLWCDGSPNSDGNERVMMPLVNRLVNESAERKESTIDEITKELHGVFHNTARMEHNDQHNSLDVPPSIPMFPSKPHSPLNHTGGILLPMH